MPAIAVTGGIACGKSTIFLQLVQTLRRYHPDLLQFSADECAHRLLRESLGVREAILQKFGATVLDSSEAISRDALRKIITQRPEKRAELEQILHPEIRQAWKDDAQRARCCSHWFVAEIPLLFETNALGFFDSVVTVACSEKSQRVRLVERGWPHSQIREILVAQTPVNDKLASAHFVIWTDVPMHIVGRQTALLADSLLHTFAE